MRTASSLLTTIWLTVASAHAQTVPLNGDFDTDVSGWTYVGPSGGAIQWDGTMGFPTPGSLQISGPPGLDGAFKAFGPCVNTQAGEIWEMQGHVYLHNPPSLAYCHVQLRPYSLTDCMGLDFDRESTLPPVNQWALSTSVLDVTDLPAPSFRPVLFVEGNDEVLCNFDAVQVQRGAAPIPALHPLGLTALMVLIVAGAIYLIRR